MSRNVGSRPFTKIREELRGKVIGIVDRHPGISAPHIAIHMGLSVDSVRDLIKETEIQRRGLAASTRYYPADWQPPTVTIPVNPRAECKAYRVDPNLLTQKAAISPDLERLKEA